MKKIVKFLSENSVCSTATSCAKNYPRSSTMEYVMVNDNLLFATDTDSIKANNLKENNRISVSVHNMPLFVTIDGTTSTPSKDEIELYNKVLFERHPEFAEMVEKGMMRPFVYFKLVPETAYFNDYSTGMSPTEIIKY